MGWNDVGGGDVDGVVGVTEVGRSDVGELEGSGAGSMLRASEGWKRGPSAENWFWEGRCVFAERQVGVLRVRLPRRVRD